MMPCKLSRTFPSDIDRSSRCKSALSSESNQKPKWFVGLQYELSVAENQISAFIIIKVINKWTQ